MPGPIATRILCDLGFEIIKVEDTGQGDYLRDLYPGTFGFLNRGKKLISMDLKKDGGKIIMKRLIEHSNVLIESFRPGVMDRLGLSYNEVVKINKNIVYCSINGGDDPGHDINYTAMNGIDKTLPVQIADTGAGMMAALRILNSLYKNVNEHIIIDMRHIPFYFNLINIFDKSMINGDYPFYTIYNTMDGSIALGAFEEKFWKNFLEFINIDGPMHDKSLKGKIDEKTSKMSSDDIIKASKIYGFPATKVSKPEVKKSENLRMGSDTVQVLKSIGFNDDDIKSFLADGSIRL
ncbi:CoA transferase [Picrophilus oshimae]|uniref:Acyl-CoA transferases/carnitine dehydratase n=1 Tax=Picrophilus torridus (strain ATCC 700027 / DSM 9790 / JCM 10055 / NBRC 100828 / KAW 2/3) TaxID=1122961 RepID=Q6L1D5_PICTO|nr:CaiB/BaiF CoA-transferase family protein [Picrophilus oshimae]AAT43217.1 acyl-CoA transferases/carnitine dehydratase [Picrophilus oshimae DSM 9789]